MSMLCPLGGAALSGPNVSSVAATTVPDRAVWAAPNVFITRGTFVFWTKLFISLGCYTLKTGAITEAG